MNSYYIINLPKSIKWVLTTKHNNSSLNSSRQTRNENTITDPWSIPPMSSNIKCHLLLFLLFPRGSKSQGTLTILPKGFLGKIQMLDFPCLGLQKNCIPNFSFPEGRIETIPTSLSLTSNFPGLKQCQMTYPNGPDMLEANTPQAALQEIEVGRNLSFLYFIRQVISQMLK